MKIKKLVCIFCILIIFGTESEIKSHEKTKSTPLRIWVCGDNTGGFSKSRMEAIRALYNQLPPAQYIIHVGDVSDGNSTPENMSRELKYVSDFIYPFHIKGNHKPLYPVPKENRFFACVGNHDVLVKPAKSENRGETFKKWLGLKKAYYKQSIPNVDLFFLDTSACEPQTEDEQKWLIGSTSGNWRMLSLLNKTTQGKWWQEELKKSKSPWKITIMHHPPFDSIKGHYPGGHADVRFPFADLGVDLVLSGHEHAYERLFDGKTHYIVQGVGGGKLRPFVTPVPISVYRYSGIGVCMLIISEQTINVEWYIDDGTGKPILKDKLEIEKKKQP